MNTRSEDLMTLDVGRLRNLLDRDAIRHIQIRYAWSLDSHRWDALAEVFLADAVADYRGERFEGLAAIVAKCASSLEPADASQHLNGCHWADVDGDKAVAGCYFIATKYVAGTPGGDTFIVGGKYIDQMVRTPDGWRIAHRLLEQTFLDGNPEVETACQTRWASRQNQ
ncbi:nuclear transport factor 2 family protein [Candidatus Poriferisocius sp.]|uniref:nuclear transport factor 2 family protein n=1 Tax=Candidatus Poriferisocius sp. TaxID=3101276 RepID=UPI003B025691